MIYTKDDLARDKNDSWHDRHFGYDIEWGKNEVDLDHYAGGPGLKYFYLMADWCIDNCNGKWSLHWNEECALFDEEEDALAFKLRWL